MGHGIRIEGGRADWYRNRWVRGSEACEILGEELPPGPREGRNDAPNTNVVGLAGRTFAIVEAGGKPVELGYELNTTEHNPFDGTLIGGYTAHPHRSEEHTSELQSLMRISYAVFCLTNTTDRIMIGKDKA